MRRASALGGRSRSATFFARRNAAVSGWRPSLMVGKAIIRATSSSYSSQRAVMASWVWNSCSSWCGIAAGRVIVLGSVAAVTVGAVRAARSCALADMTSRRRL